MTRIPLIVVLAAAAVSCGGDKTISSDTGTGGGDADVDADSDTDTDTDADDEAGDSIEEATPIELGLAPEAPLDFGDTYITWDAIDPAGDRDFYALEVNEGEVVTVATLAYYFDKDGEPDTVLRLYDQDGNLLLTNDDMPFRFLETDSALHWQATYTGTYYVEVLEWSDWATDESSGPVGGPSYEYELHGWLEELVQIEPNDDFATLDGYRAKYDTDWILWNYDWFSEYATDFIGMIDEKGDVDVYSLSFSEDSDGAYYMLALWPYAPVDFQPVLSLYDADGNLVGRTTDPTYSVEWQQAWNYDTFFYDVGIVFRVRPGVYYVTVEDAAGGAGVGTYFQGILIGYVPELAQAESGNNDFPGGANEIGLTESSSTPGWYYARISGDLPGDDAADWWAITADSAGGSLDGSYLQVNLCAEHCGSLLDAKITVYGSDGTTVLAQTSTNDVDGGADPVIADLELGDESTVYVVVEADEPSKEPAASSYFGFVAVTPSPEF